MLQHSLCYARDANHFLFFVLFVSFTAQRYASAVCATTGCPPVHLSQADIPQEQQNDQRHTVA